MALTVDFGAKVLYTNRSDNAVVVTLTPDAAAQLTGGPVVAEDDADQHATTLVYLQPDLGSSAPDPSVLHVSCDGWAAEYLAGFWSLAPVDSAVVTDPVRIHITGWPVFTAASSSGQLYVEYHRFGGDTAWTRDNLMVQAAPGAKPSPLRLGLDFGVAGDGRSRTDHVYVWNQREQDAVVENTLTMRLTNREKHAIVSGPGTRFQLLFPEAAAPSAGTFTMLGNPAPVAPGGWSAQLDDQAAAPCWTFTPPPSSQILGPAVGPDGGPNLKGDQTVEFSLKGLVVAPPTGVAPVYVQHLDVPDHDDGFNTKGVDKFDAPAGILDFECLTGYTPAAGSEVRLTWKTYGVDRLQLSYTYNQKPKTLSTPHEIPFSAKEFVVPERIEDLTTFTLTAAGAGPLIRSPSSFSVTPYATDVELSNVRLAPTILAQSAPCTLTFRTANATAVTLAIDEGSGSVGLTVGADGHVVCQLSQVAPGSIAVTQDDVSKGSLSLPARKAGAAGTTSVILRIVAESAQESAALTVCAAAPPTKAELVLIKTTGAGDQVELHVAAGSSRFQTRAVIPTSFNASEASNGIWTLAPRGFEYTAGPAVLFVKMRNTWGGPVEVHYVTAKSQFTAGGFEMSGYLEQAVQSGTFLTHNAGPVEAELPPYGVYLVYLETALSDKEPNVAIQGRRDTDNFIQMWLQGRLVTCYRRTAQPEGTWLLADFTPRISLGDLPDLVYIQTRNTASKRVELSYAIGKSNYQAIGHRWVTGFPADDAAAGTWRLADVTGAGGLDLVFVKTAKTSSGRVEAYYALAAEDYANPVGGYTGFAIADGSNGAWQVVPGGTFAAVTGARRTAASIARRHFDEQHHLREI